MSAEMEPAEGLIEAFDPKKSKKIYLHKKVELEKKDVVWARHGFDELLKAHSVSIKFTEDGSKKIEKLTKRMAGKRLAILLDGKVVSAPIIEAELSETAILSGLKKEDALKLAKALDAK